MGVVAAAKPLARVAALSSDLDPVSTGGALGNCGQPLRALCVQCGVADAQIRRYGEQFCGAAVAANGLKLDKKWIPASIPGFPLRR